MPFIFNGQAVVDAIKTFKTKNLLEINAVDCKFDFENGEFLFKEGVGCAEQTGTSRIGSKITKRAIREMVNRYKVAVKSAPEEIFCIDYGIDIIKSILDAQTEGIRFYFGKRNIGDGKDFISLILVGLDSKGNEIVNQTLGETDVAGVEVGHGHSFKEYEERKEDKTFKLANF